MSINHQLSDSASPAELATHVKTVEAGREPFSVLTINGGSSSIKFALYQVGEPLKRGLHGKVDRICLSGTNLTFTDLMIARSVSRVLHLGAHRRQKP